MLINSSVTEGLRAFFYKQLYRQIPNRLMPFLVQSIMCNLSMYLLFKNVDKFICNIHLQLKERIVIKGTIQYATI
ncbi:hypothetical protein GJ496_011805 [Pomphorhynchus laevis]|nr:hypothetical protein GJ496_011805 [Pomphorhynchus laevis]